jgi:hypothetical protein
VTTHRGAPSAGDAVFVALCLVPHSYSRNKFFELFLQPEMATARRRARRVRSVVRHILRAEDPKALELTQTELADSTRAISYRVEPGGATRVVHLDPLEAAALHVCLAKARGQSPPSECSALVESALRLLDEAPIKQASEQPQ